MVAGLRPRGPTFQPGGPAAPAARLLASARGCSWLRRSSKSPTRTRTAASRPKRRPRPPRSSSARRIPRRKARSMPTALGRAINRRMGPPPGGLGPGGPPGWPRRSGGHRWSRRFRARHISGASDPGSGRRQQGRPPLARGGGERRPSGSSARPTPRRKARSTRTLWPAPSTGAWGRLPALVPADRAGRWVRSASWSSSSTRTPTAG